MKTYRCTPHGHHFESDASHPLCKSCGTNVVEEYDQKSHTGMSLMVGDLLVEYEWHPTKEGRQIHTVVRVPEADILFELPGNWHAPFIIELAVITYLNALSRQLLSHNPISAFKLGEMHGLVWQGKAKQKRLGERPPCSTCGGTGKGHKQGFHHPPCDTCGGTGKQP